MPMAMLLAVGASAAADCGGHKLLSRPRPEASCQTETAQVYVSPDQALHAAALPVDVSLYATPDMESRVVIRSSAGDTLTSKDYSSPRGTDGYYVYAAQWSPDSQFFAYSMASSGGHSPWSFPIMVYSRKRNLFAAFSDMIDGRPSVSEQFQFAGPHTLVAGTWRQPGTVDDKIAVSVDLDQAFDKLAGAALHQ